MDVKTPKGDCGVIIARFQTPGLTGVHIQLIESVKKRHKKFIVVLGISRHIPSKLNPFDFATRLAMIQKLYPGTIILPLNDVRYDEDWSGNLDTLLMGVMQMTSMVLYGARDSFVKTYTGKFPTVEFENIGEVSGTQARAEAFHEVLDTQDFRAGICYAMANKYPSIIPTVDVAIVRGGQVLLGRKPGEKYFRFIGGYAEKNESYEHTAKREAIEEAGINSVGNDQIQYIGSTPIKDWRYEGSPDQIKTSLFVLNYPSGPIKAGDDIEEVEWFNIDIFDRIPVMPEHEVLRTMFLEWLRRKGF